MDALIETALSILPNADWAKIVGLLVIGFVILVATGRFQLEWIGQLSRHIVRWLRCKIRNRHYWRSLDVAIIIDGPPRERHYRCQICGKLETRPPIDLSSIF